MVDLGEVVETSGVDRGVMGEVVVVVDGSY